METKMENETTERVWEDANHPNHAGQETRKDAVYRLLMALLAIFLIRTLVSASIFHYVFNATMPHILRSVMGSKYDRLSFEKLPFSSAVLIVVALSVLFPIK